MATININSNNLESIIGKLSLYNKDEYICPLTRKIINDNELFDVYTDYAINKFAVSLDKINIFNSKPVPYIYCSYPYYIVFVFEIIDTREKYSKVLNDLTTILPQIAIDKIAFYLGCNKVKNNYMSTDFPTKFESKYNGPIPDKFSHAQLKKLYELGIVKPAFHSNNGMILLLSDEAFDYLEQSNLLNFDPREQENENDDIWVFRNKENMRKWLKKHLKMLLI